MNDVSCPVPYSDSLAHSQVVEESAESALSLRELSAYNHVVIHQIYDCPVYCWLAAGPVKVSKVRDQVEIKYFLYCEYRDRYSACQYVVYTFSSLDEALIFQKQTVSRQVLPDISPEQTRLCPVQPAAQ